MMTPRKTNILKTDANFWAMTRPMLGDALEETNDRVLRRLLQQLVEDGFLQRIRSQVFNPAWGDAPMPVYVITRKGLEFLACEYEDEKYLKFPTHVPQWQTLPHTLAVVKVHMLVRKAFAKKGKARLVEFIGEWELKDEQAKEPEKRYRTYTAFNVPDPNKTGKLKRIACIPDATFVIAVEEFIQNFYLEFDNDTSGISQIANSKTPGFAELARTNAHRRHSTTNVDIFKVISISPSEGRRNLLSKELKGKPGAEHWLFSAWTDLTPESFLYEPVWIDVEGEPRPLVKSDVASVDGPMFVTAGQASGQEADQ